jgi:hypothetical protein
LPYGTAQVTLPWSWHVELHWLLAHFLRLVREALP